MFWSANYTSMRELNFLLKEENVTLTQVLEADDILQECKADNKDLIRFLTKPEILAELITLITKESPEDVDLTIQYRYSNIACEVLTSQLSGLSHHLCKDVEQMNRLCDFLNQDPPLNPLLASYFSRTIEALLKRSSKQDCYLHHILCLYALDFFKARKDFVPNLLRHIATSAIADTFKYFIFYLGEPFSEIIMEWLDKHHFLEKLIEIICCSYKPEEIEEPISVPPEKETQNNVEEEASEESEKLEVNHKDCHSAPISENKGEGGRPDDAERSRRLAAAASGSACDVACGLAGDWAEDDWPTTKISNWAARLRSEPLLHRLLIDCFTCPSHLRDVALLNACRLLRALLRLSDEEQRRIVACVVAQHMRSLREALGREPDQLEGGRRRVGAARLQVAALLAELAASREPEVHAAARAQDTAAVLLDLFFDFPDNNFLHAHVCTLLINIARNDSEAPTYWQRLVGEGELLTRLMDTFEESQDKKRARRSSVMGHVTAACRTLASAQAAAAAPDTVRQRWEAFLQTRLDPLLARLDSPLGGEYPSDTSYEIGNIATVCADAAYEVESGKESAPRQEADLFGAEMWEDSPTEVLDSDEAAHLSYPDVTSISSTQWGRWGWAGEGQEEEEEEGWAQFGNEANLAPIDPFAPLDTALPWNRPDGGVDPLTELERGLSEFQVHDAAELTQNLLSAMSGLAPHHLAEITNTPPQPEMPPSELTPEADVSGPSPAPDQMGGDNS